jgi:hypothetical protein
MGSTVVALAVVFTLLAVFLVGVGLVFFLRARRAKQDAEKGSRIRDANSGRIRPISTWTVDPRHPASRITPFGTRDGEHPRRFTL